MRTFYSGVNKYPLIAVVGFLFVANLFQKAGITAALVGMSLPRLVAEDRELLLELAELFLEPLLCGVKLGRVDHRRVCGGKHIILLHLCTDTRFHIGALAPET